MTAGSASPTRDQDSVVIGLPRDATGEKAFSTAQIDIVIVWSFDFGGINLRNLLPSSWPPQDG